MMDLGTLGGPSSSAFKINDRGQVVGWSDTSTGTSAFLFAGGKMLDLNSLIRANYGWRLTAGYDINDKGQIVGEATSYIMQGGFLLTKRPE
jgi:probable HAF family extracellular repeat protein